MKLTVFMVEEDNMINFNRFRGVNSMGNRGEGYVI